MKAGARNLLTWAVSYALLRPFLGQPNSSAGPRWLVVSPCGHIMERAGEAIKAYACNSCEKLRRAMPLR